MKITLLCVFPGSGVAKAEAKTVMKPTQTMKPSVSQTLMMSACLPALHKRHQQTTCPQVRPLLHHDDTRGCTTPVNPSPDPQLALPMSLRLQVIVRYLVLHGACPHMSLLRHANKSAASITNKKVELQSPCGN